MKNPYDKRIQINGSKDLGNGCWAWFIQNTKLKYFGSNGKARMHTKTYYDVEVLNEDARPCEGSYFNIPTKAMAKKYFNKL